MRAFVVVLLIGLVVGACRPKIPNYPYEKEPDPRSKELVLGAGDTIAINVWENRDLNTEATIRPDGTITMPLVGDLKAAGETPSSLKAQITAKLVDFVKLQQGTDLVTVAVREWRSYRFTVQGEVTRQGNFTANHFVTVAEAIAMAGGVSRFAKRHEVVVFREDPRAPGGKRKIPIDYDLVLSGKRPDMNIWILPNDTIYVP